MRSTWEDEAYNSSLFRITHPMIRIDGSMTSKYKRLYAYPYCCIKRHVCCLLVWWCDAAAQVTNRNLCFGPIIMIRRTYAGERVTLVADRVRALSSGKSVIFILPLPSTIIPHNPPRRKLQSVLYRTSKTAVKQFLATQKNRSIYVPCITCLMNT